MRALIKPIVIVLALITGSYKAVAEINIVTSINPIANIAAGITAGVTTPTRLLPVNVSPHHFQLTPRAATKLNHANLVIWVGPELETSLSKIINNLAKPIKVITLLEHKNIHLLNFQNSDTNNIDPHIWLDPHNGIAIAKIIAEEISKIDPENKKTYLQNLAKITTDLTQLDTTITHELKKIQTEPYLIYHNAYHYFTQRYNLHPGIVISNNSAQALSARQLQQLEKIIVSQKIKTLYREPQYQINMLAELQKKYDLTVLPLDPIGQTTTVSFSNYINLILALRNSFLGLS